MTPPETGDAQVTPGAPRRKAPRAATDPRAALLCCLAAGFATLLDATVVAFTAPPVATTLGATTAGVQWFLASYSLTFGLGLVPAGRLGDAFGRRGLFIAGLVTFLLGGIASALAPAVWVLVTGRLLQGLGAGFISAQVLGIIQDTFHGTARVRALGAYSAVGAAAAIVGPLAGGALLEALPTESGWRWVLLTPIPFTTAAIWLGARGLPRDRPGRISSGLDLPGIAMLGAFVVIVTLPVIDPGLPLPMTLGIAAVAVVLAGAIMVWERRYARRGRLPLFAPSLMRSAGFVTGNIVALLWFGSLLALSTATTVYFLQAHSISAFTVAIAFVPSALARMVASQLSHRVFLRVGRPVVALGVGIELVGVLAILAAAFVWDGWPLLLAVSALQVLLGLAGGLVEPPLRAITLGFADPALHGVAASFLQLTQRLSATFFVALATGVLLGAGDGITQDGLRWAIMICAVACVVALIAALRPSFRGPDVLPAVSAGPGAADADGDTVPVGSTTNEYAAWTPIRVEWHDDRAAALRAAMDVEIGARYGDLVASYDAELRARYDRDFALDPRDIVATVLVLDADGTPLGHAALRQLGNDLEVKRVFVQPHGRGRGVSVALMTELESIAVERGAPRLILQTGDRQPEAVRLYQKLGYRPIEPFPPYADWDLSLCFEKVLSA
ncbi:MFS transporter [Microbacterium sp.]|uniref:MFS transporter n=1 Tax=Microbacterium sp. TaxID=51671 RepID=UPI003C777BC8